MPQALLFVDAAINVGLGNPNRVLDILPTLTVCRLCRLG